MSEKVFIIAEVGQAHDGSLGILHSYIDAISATGVDAIKFQTHIAEAESSAYEPFRVKFSYEDDCRFDYWKRMSFTEEQWKGIKAHCDDVGVEFISSPFSIAAVELLERVGVGKYKIGSGEVSNFLLLDRIAATKKEVLLSSGMSSFKEIDQAVALFRDAGSKLSIFQCTTSYPTKPSDVGLNVIEEMIGRYQLPVGLSDHSGSIYASLAAVALGATLLEVHSVFDKRMFGPDSSSSLDMGQLEQLVTGVREISTMLSCPVDKTSNASFEGLKEIFEKSIAVSKPVKQGEVLTLDVLEAKKPASRGVAASQYESVLGRKALRDVPMWDFLSWEDLSDE